MGEQAAENRLHNPDRPYLWLVNYDMDPSFFNLSPEEQYQRESADGAHAVALAFEGEWKAGYISTDFKRGWILLDLGKKTNQAEAEKVIQGYPVHTYFRNITYTPVYSATRAGFDPKLIWSGFKEFLDNRF